MTHSTNRQVMLHATDMKTVPVYSVAAAAVTFNGIARRLHGM